MIAEARDDDRGRRGERRARDARPWAFVVTCEHGGPRVPVRLSGLFKGRDAQAALRSHRGHDPGALPMARTLARTLRAPLLASTITRLVVDLNRSPGHPRWFSPWTRELPDEAKAAIVARWYRPHREAVEAAIAARVNDGDRVLHVASHSFTPVLDGVVRRVDVGLLYDPGREGERALVARWIAALAGRRPSLAIRRNAPYRGTSDGLTTALRRRFGPASYVGIELEINQRLVADARAFARLRADVAAALRDAAGVPVP